VLARTCWFNRLPRKALHAGTYTAGCTGLP